MKPFLDRLLDGEVPLDQVNDQLDDAIAAWHLSGPKETRPLPEYLGMTEEEYSRWVENGRALLDIIKERRLRQERQGVLQSRQSHCRRS